MQIKVHFIGDIASNYIGNKYNWRVLSVHTHSLNIVNELGAIVTLASKELGRGPFIITTENFPFYSIGKSSKVKIRDGKIEIGEIALNISDCKIYDSRLNINPISRDKEYWLHWQQSIVSWLLATEYADFYKKSFVPKMKAISDNELINLIGYGYGTTPTGDDFLAGYIIGHLTLKKSIPQTFKYNVEKNLKKTNLISANYIRMAILYRVNEKIKKSLEKLFLGYKIEPFNEEKGFGYTSGLDFLLGFTEYYIRHTV